MDAHSPDAPGALSPTTASDPALGLMNTPMHALLRRDPVTLPPQTSIREAAQRMREQRVSSVIIVEQGLLFGLVTDRDLRNRVLAAGLDPERPIADIATLAPFSVDMHSPALEAMLLMTRHNIHHVPVLDGQRIAGMVTANDLNEPNNTSAIYLAGNIHRQTSVEGLRQASGRVRRLLQSLVDADASALATGHIVTTITDALTIRLLQLGEARLGPAPVAYAWVAAGSQARCEQTAKTDQDNCMVLDDAYDEARHGDYFRQLAAFVCDGLNACGYVYCPGDMMASNPAWRLPLAQWAALFAGWTDEPEPTALMLTCVFFDMRCVHGQATLLQRLRTQVLARSRGNTLLLAHLVANAMGRRPPLGWFGRLQTARTGEHKGTIDLKLHGIAPIVDIARIHALAIGDAAIGSHERLQATGEGAVLSEQDTRDLRDALEFLATLRIRHQARLMAEGQAPDNHLDPRAHSNFERTQLRDALRVVRDVQDLLEQRFGGGRL